MYATNNYGEFMEKPIFCGESLSGISTVLPDKNNSGRPFEGCGVAITGSSCYNLSLMDKEERQSLLKKIYSPSGLNCSVGRLSIGSSDYSAEIYTYDDVKDDIALEHFSIDRDKEYIIPIIKEILEIKPDLKLLASPWSPPGWMKTGGSLGGGHMREKYLDCYAEYLIKYIKAYRSEGIKLYAITPQNETASSQNGKMPACIWHPDIEAKFVGILKKKIDENNINIKIWIYDHDYLGVPRVDWCLSEYPNLKNECDGMAFHYYGGSIEQTALLRKKYPNLELHFTEGGPRLFENYGTDWCKWTTMVIRAMRLGYSSFTGWNLMLDETGGPNVGPFFCGGLVTRNSIDGSLSYSGQYKAFRHFAMVSPEAEIYPLKFDRSDKPMFGFPNHSHYYTEGVMLEEEGKTMLILSNPSEEKEQLQYFYKNRWWYIEMLPNTAVSIVFEE